MKLTRETWEKSSDDGVGKEGGGREGARQSEATISRGALMDKRNNQRRDGRGRTNAATRPILPITVVRRLQASLTDNNGETVEINLIPPACPPMGTGRRHYG